MKKIDEMIEKLLDMDIVGADNSIIFTDEAKKLIHDIAEECKSASMIVDNKDLIDEYGKGLTAEDVYVDMLNIIERKKGDIYRNKIGVGRISSERFFYIGM